MDRTNAGFPADDADRSIVGRTDAMLPPTPPTLIAGPTAAGTDDDDDDDDDDWIPFEPDVDDASPPRPQRIDRPRPTPFGMLLPRPPIQAFDPLLDDDDIGDGNRNNGIWSSDWPAGRYPTTRPPTPVPDGKNDIAEKYDDLTESIVNWTDKLRNLTCRICQSPVESSAGYYQCINHPISSAEDADDRKIGTGKAAAAIKRLKRLSYAPAACIPCLAAWLSERLSKTGDGCVVCPFVRDDDISNRSSVCQFKPSDQLVAALSMVLPELRLTYAADDATLIYRASKPRTPLYQASIGIRLAISRQSADAWSAIRRDDAGAGTSLQQRFGIRCDFCGLMSVLDRLLFLDGRLPLTVRCLFCSTWICTGCERTVPIDPPVDLRPVPPRSLLLSSNLPVSIGSTKRRHDDDGSVAAESRHRRLSPAEPRRNRRSSVSPRRRDVRSISPRRRDVRSISPQHRCRSSISRRRPSISPHRRRSSISRGDRWNGRDNNNNNRPERTYDNRSYDNTSRSETGTTIRISWTDPTPTTPSPDLTDQVAERWYAPHRMHRSGRHLPAPRFDISNLGQVGDWINILKPNRYTDNQIEYRPIYLRAVIEKSRTKCPRCLTPVTKNDACVHVHCICGCKFCYCCGGTLHSTLAEYIAADKTTAAALHLPGTDPSVVRLFDPAADASSYSVDLHHLALNRSLCYNKPVTLAVPLTADEAKLAASEGHIPVDSKTAISTTSVFDFRLLAVGSSCPNLLEKIPDYAKMTNDIELLQLIPADDPDGRWSKSDFAAVSKLDRFTGQFEIAKAVVALRKTRLDIGAPMFNDAVDRLRQRLADDFDDGVNGVKPSAYELALMRAAVAYFPVL